MGSKSFLVLCVLLSVAHNVLGYVWEFGCDPGYTEVVAHQTGCIGRCQKLTTIQLTVLPCYDVEYVKVELVGESEPVVAFNKETNEVTIAFDAQQPSTSSYDVLARGSRRFGCEEASRGFLGG